MTTTLDRDRERLLANPANPRAFQVLEERYFLAGDWPRLVDLYEKRLAAPDLAARPEARAQLWLRLGQIHEERRGDPDRAIGAYRQALASEARFRPALQQLRRIHGQRGQWDLTLQIAEMEAALPMEGAERAALLADTGLVWLERLGDAEQARDHFAKALEVEPRHGAALRGFARALQACGQSELAATAWQRLAEQLRGAERADALVALARLLEGPLARVEAAAELYRRALSDNPRSPDAVEAVAADARRKRQWPLLADLMERRFELAQTTPQRVAIALEAGRLEREQLGNGAAARMWYARAAQIGPDAPEVFEALAEIERERGDDDGMRQALERAVALRGDAAPLSSLLELASLHSALREDSRALVHLQRAYRLAPDDALVVEALSDTLLRLGRYPELAAVLEQRAALPGTDVATAAAVYAELGALRERRLGDRRGARDAYARSFAARPTQPAAAAALERLYRADEDWDALRTFLAEAARSGPSAERPRYLCALGDLLAQRLARPGEATRAYEAALALDAGCLGAHRGLQQLAAASGDVEAVIRAFEREAEVSSDRMRLAHLVGELVPRLEATRRPEQALAWALRWLEAAPDEVDAYQECARLYQQLGLDAELVGVLEKLDPLLTGPDQARNRKRLAEHHAACGRLDAAIRICRAALEADPRDAETQGRLVGHLEGAGRLEELAQARRWLADLLPPVERARCLDALARLLAEQLDDPAGAIGVLLEVAGEPAAPADLEPRLEALLERSGRWEELVARLAERAAQLPAGSPEAVALGLRRAGTLLAQLERLEEAAAVYREVRTATPDSEEARLGLERALRAADRPEALAEFLAEEAERAPTPGARERAALERAVLLEERLDRIEEARECYGELALAATQAAVAGEASRRLESLLERCGAWDALREHLETQPLEAELELSRRLRLARLCRDRLGDAEAAIGHFRRAAEILPTQPGIWRELAALLEATGRHDELMGVLEAELETGPEPERELALRAGAAALAAGPLADPTRARAHYERVLELDPVHPTAAEYLITCWERDGRHAAVLRLLRARLDHVESAPEPDADQGAERMALRLRIASLSAGSLGDLDAAIAALEPLLGALGVQPAIAEPLAELYRRAGYAEDYAALCRRAATACGDPGERACWWLRLADALRERGELGPAAEAYRQALDERPDDRAIQASLRDLYRALGEAKPLARLLAAELERPACADELPLRLELAGLLADGLERPADALEQLKRVLQLQPGNAEALDRALALVDRLGDPALTSTLLELVDAGLAEPSSPARRAELLLRRARTCARLPGRGEEAVLAYRQTLALAPAQPAIRRELRSLLEGQGRFDAVLECLLEEAHGAESGARAALFETAAGIALQHFSADAALPWLRRLRAERPLDASVSERIGQIHRRAERWDALLRALDDQLELLTHRPHRRDLLVEKAHILEDRFGSGIRAAAALEQARRELPRDREVLERLDRLYREADRPRERASVLEAQLREAGSDASLMLHCELAALYGGPLAEPESAARHLLLAVAATPQGSAMRAELLAALGDALRGAGRTDAWARCAEEELRCLDAQAPVFAERRRELRSALALAYEQALGRPRAALRHLRALVDDRPSGADPSDAALDASELALLRLLRAEGLFAELEARASTRFTRREASAEDWLELARLRAERLHALPAAAEAYARVLERDPGSLPAIRGWRGIAERLGDWRQVASSLQRELDHLGPATRAEKTALLRRLGDVCWHQLGSTTRASRSYAAALECDPHDFASLRSLQQLLESMEDWGGALDLYESEIEVLGEAEPARRQAVWLRVGELARERSGEIERARVAYLRAAEAAPLAAAQRRELAELHQRCGDPAAFAAVFASWCDDAAAQAQAADQLRLAQALEELGQYGPARVRVERALALDSDLAPAWDALARLLEAEGERAEAARALCRAAEHLSDAEAGRRLLRAAELSGEDDPEGAAALLRSAARRDPGSAAVHAQRARVCAALHRSDEVVEAARLALDLGDALEPAARLEVALHGGRASHERGRGEETARFYSEALALAPDHPEALAGYGSALALQEDLEGARRVLERRVAPGDAYPERALHLVIIGRALEAAGQREAAQTRYEEALREDPQLDEGHARLVRLLERANRPDAGIAALERWAEAARDPSERSERLLRAAAWALRAGGHESAAERYLRAVLEATPRSATTWEALARLLWDQGRHDAALEVANAGLETLDEPAPRATLALVRARVLERHGERRAAAEAFARAAEADPGCAEAVLSAARLLRGLGEWRAAAAALESFEARNPDAPPCELAEVLHQLGRLLAGPLEDLEGALRRYQRAVLLDPERRDVRVALAELASHRSGEWRQALTQLRILLEADPSDATALRMLLRVARNRGASEATARALTLVRAVGIASPGDLEEARSAPRHTLAEPGVLDDPVGEVVRQLAVEAAEGLAEALAVSEGPPATAPGGAEPAFRAAAHALEGRLSARALLPLPLEEVAEVMTLVASLCFETEEVRGSAERVNALSNALGRRARRRLRRVLGDLTLGQVAGLDFGAWRDELRALAAAVALEETGGDLRTALLALLRDHSESLPGNPGEHTDLTPQLAVCPPARALARRAVRACLASL